MSKEKQVAESILALVGGKENILSVEHCATRFQKNEIEKIESVKGSFLSSGQHQIILGTGFVNKVYTQIIYVFLTIFLYLLKCPQSLILSALRAFCFCGKPHISRSIFLYFRYQAWLKSW